MTQETSQVLSLPQRPIESCSHNGSVGDQRVSVVKLSSIHKTGHLIPVRAFAFLQQQLLKSKIERAQQNMARAAKPSAKVCALGLFPADRVSLSALKLSVDRINTFSKITLSHSSNFGFTQVKRRWKAKSTKKLNDKCLH